MEGYSPDGLASFPARSLGTTVETFGSARDSSGFGYILLLLAYDPVVPLLRGKFRTSRLSYQSFYSMPYQSYYWLTEKVYHQVSYFNMIRAGDITFHQNGWPENTTLQSAQEIWSIQEQAMKNALEGAIKPVFPRLVRVGSESELDPECQGSMLKMLIGVRSMKTWAINSKFRQDHDATCCSLPPRAKQGNGQRSV